PRRVPGGHAARPPPPPLERPKALGPRAPLFEVRHSAETGHERAAEVAEEGEIGCERGVELGGPEVEERVAGATLESPREASTGGGGEAVVGGAGLDPERAGRQDG